MTPETEIRKLTPSSTKELFQILEYNDSWKRLMAIIPKTLSKTTFECNVHVHNLPKYNSEHFKMVENASDKMRKLCTEILFDEWGTSGRIRPALGHVLYLLVKAELFRAADYVAINLLKSRPPDRPAEGLAAHVDVKFSVQTNPGNPQLQDVERILNEINYPSSVIENLNATCDTNIDHSRNDRGEHVIPKIVVSETPNANKVDFIPLVVEQGPRRQRSLKRQESVEEVVVSDMMKFTQSDVCSSSDNCSELTESTGDFTNSNMPDISGLQLNSGLNPDINPAVEDSSVQLGKGQNLPNLSALNLNSSQDAGNNHPAFSQLLPEETNASPDNADLLPNFSVLGNSSSESFIPNLSALGRDSKCDNPSPIPQFSALRSDISEKSAEARGSSNYSSKSIFSDFSQGSKASSTGSRPACVSPLPNLSLNTVLPHFNYHELENATNAFDETPHKNCREMEDSLSKSNGRFLGTGGFGSVFLALGIAERPVAVKRLFLNNAAVVNEDDMITIQFRNEVELLYKYKHDNLVTLLGYSCDGPTYCLLYEYIAGGALKDRLQNSDDPIMWNDRLNIALGTARAVAYLHTAYSMALIHRDIKTANILLDCSKIPKLCDFGLIRLTPNQNTNTMTRALGTSAYMAPEALRGDVSVKMDTFSFGVVLLELLTSLPPFDESREGWDIVTHIRDTCEDDLTPILDTNAGPWVAKGTNFADRLFAIANKCLAEKQNRPTMVVVSSQLDELVEQLNH